MDTNTLFKTFIRLFSVYRRKSTLNMEENTNIDKHSLFDDMPEDNPIIRKEIIHTIRYNIFISSLPETCEPLAIH